MASNLYNTASVLVPKGAAGRASVIDAYRPAFNVLQSIGITRNDANGSFRNQQGLIEFAAANVPRFNWDEGDSCPKLLVEPSRENLLTYSDFDAGVPTNWVVGFGTGTFTHTLTSYKGQSAITHAQTVSGRSYLSQSLTLSTTTEYTFNLQVDLSNTSGVGASSVIVSFQNFTGATGTTNILFSDLDADGRASITFTTAADGTGEIRIGIGCTVNDTGTITFGMPQLEAGSYRTSWIATEATTQTRNADVISQTGLASLIGDSEGTLYVEGEAFDADGSGISISLSDGTANNRVFIGKNTGSSPIRGIVSVGGVAQFDGTASNWVDNTIKKLAISYAVNDFTLYIDGVQSLTDTSGSTFSDGTLTKFGLDAGLAGSFFYGKISVLAWWQARLDNDVLESLTSYETYEEMAATLDYTID